MTVDAFLTPYFPESVNQFDNKILIMIDVLRAGSSVCASLHNGAKEVLAYESLDKAVSVYSSLSKESRFLGGERNCQKPSGFDAGNSPTEYTEEAVQGKSVILSTTNGSKIFQKGKNARLRVVGGFVNIDSIIDYISSNYLTDEESITSADICIMCAGTNGRLSYEDTLCAGAFINYFYKTFDNVLLTDAADAAKNLYNLHSFDLLDFIKTREHAKTLKANGMESDIDLCLTRNAFPVVPVIEGNSIKKA
jgi:2-phosphosulfolactate phosphatase